MLCAVYNSHLLLNYFLGYLLVRYVNISVKRLKFAPLWAIYYFQPILAAISVTIATVKYLIKKFETFTLWILF